MGAFQASIGTFVGDSGSGGQVGLVPAPATGDAAALKYLKANGTWAATPSSTVAVLSVVSKTTTYTATSADDVILCSGSAFTVNLYTAVGNSGRVLKVKKTDSSLTNIITLDGNASETIDGALTATLNTQYEEIEILSDGTNWQILTRTYPQVWVAYTPTIVGFGAAASISFFSRRVGDSLQGRGTFTSGTPSGVPGTFTIGYNGTSANVSADTAKFPSVAVFGNAETTTANSTSFNWTVVYNASATALGIGFQGSASQSTVAQNGNGIGVSNGGVITLYFEVPIVGWN